MSSTEGPSNGATGAPTLDVLAAGIKRALEHAVARAGSTADRAADRAARTGTAAAAGARSALGFVEHAIKTHPFAAVAIACGAGFVAARLSRRMSRRS
jgi:ElaB/YqjD/DUF883 family membrane-anchored ribosome-binding protein